MTASTVLYYTPERWEAHAIGNRTMFQGNVIEILYRRLRPDLGNGNDYFDITYRYVG